MNQETVSAMKEKARAVRLGIIDALGIDKRGHLGGSMSCADIVAALKARFRRPAQEQQDVCVTMPAAAAYDVLLASQGAAA